MNAKEAIEMTAFGALIAGLVAGAVGTAVMDLVWFQRYRRGGGQSSFVEWEFSAGLNSWEAAPAPAHVGRLMFETVTRRSLGGRYAAVTNNAVHWTYGIFWGGLYGLLGWAFLGRNVAWGLAFGFVVWASSYVTLPLLGLYKPMWQYDLKTLARDLSAHLAYGLGAAGAFALLAR
jgi:uncharacterized membrane protein YagU involved in acid resistance